MKQLKNLKKAGRIVSAEFPIDGCPIDDTLESLDMKSTEIDEPLVAVELGIEAIKEEN